MKGWNITLSVLVAALFLLMGGAAVSKKAIKLWGSDSKENSDSISHESREEKVKLGERTTGPVVGVEVYYESLCPDSRRFVITQLYPVYESIGDVMNITLVPYGKASYSPREGGGWNFTCQHGPGECYGNRGQSCLIHYYPDQSVNVPFVNCLMDFNNYPPVSGPKCARSLNVNYTQVSACNRGVESEDLLQANGVLTENLDPTLTYVPWLTFNGVFNRADFRQGQTNLLAVVCRYLDPKPTNCSSAKLDSWYEDP